MVPSHRLQAGSSPGNSVQGHLASPGMNVSPVWPPATPFQWYPGFAPPGEVMYEVKIKNLFRQREGISTVLVW